MRWGALCGQRLEVVQRDYNSVKQEPQAQARAQAPGPNKYEDLPDISDSDGDGKLLLLLPAPELPHGCGSSNITLVTHSIPRL